MPKLSTYTIDSDTAKQVARLENSHIINDNLSGTGTTQGTATQLLPGKNRATTVTATNNAFVGPASGDFSLSNDDAADDAQLFPPTSADYGAGANAPLTIAPNNFAKLEQKTATVWVLVSGTVDV